MTDSTPDTHEPTNPADPPVTTARGSREIAEALGFEPDNHHNAAVCPYCTHNGSFVMVSREDVSFAASAAWVASLLATETESKQAYGELAERLRSVLDGV